jgi:hypothetical protein
MANFDPPFASVGGVNRSPTTDEQADGFPCGSADVTLLHRLFGRIEAELKAIQDEGGIVGSETDDTTVLQAIQALINAATGGGSTSDYVLFSQATTRLPIYPEVTTNAGVIPVTSPSTGNVRIPASSVILHRGIRPYTTVQVDLSTVASKTYHLRWTPSGGAAGTFVLKDLADTGYNPTTASEANPAFDSTYDDVLIARVVTNSSNVATITPLKNQSRITTDFEQFINNPGYDEDTPPSGLVTSPLTVALNYSRKPLVMLSGFTDATVQTSQTAPTNGAELSIAVQCTDRYTARLFYQRTVLPSAAYVAGIAVA